MDAETIAVDIADRDNMLSKDLHAEVQVNDAQQRRTAAAYSDAVCWANLTRIPKVYLNFLCKFKQ
jgi:hypothetical protein